MSARKPARRRRPTAAAKARAAEVLARLGERYPDADCALDHANAFQLLAATILSAQCTDARVNQVTPELFARWPTPAALARASQDDVEQVIRSTGFFRNKAKNLIAMAVRLEQAYGGKVPRAMDHLLTLPGVARKTANVVRGVVFGLADGVVVDTHVKRIAGLLGWTKATDPVRIEADLMALLPPESWIEASHRLILLGREICIARRPRCGECPLADLCPSASAGQPARAGARRPR
ncbi:MAG: endonuclease III [Planctomycetota bacterium]